MKEISKIKCKNCNHTSPRIRRFKKWYWIRCANCGFHTSSYLSENEAKKAWANKEHYVSENGNKLIHNGMECVQELNERPYLKYK